MPGNVARAGWRRPQNRRRRWQRRNGLAHKHCGSLHAADATMALQAARDIYTRRGEGLSIWVVPSNAITASDPTEKGMMFEPAESKIYRHPTFYDVPEEVGHM
jgi:ring-1,2-phenylacetyl-CoA epoxidase subunit PaaB